MTLARERCVACRRDSPRVTDDEIAELHPGVAECAVVGEADAQGLAIDAGPAPPDADDVLPEDADPA